MYFSVYSLFAATTASIMTQEHINSKLQSVYDLAGKKVQTWEGYAPTLRCFTNVPGAASPPCLLAGRTYMGSCRSDVLCTACMDACLWDANVAARTSNTVGRLPRFSIMFCQLFDAVRVHAVIVGVVSQPCRVAHCLLAGEALYSLILCHGKKANNACQLA